MVDNFSAVFRSTSRNKVQQELFAVINEMTAKFVPSVQRQVSRFDVHLLRRSNLIRRADQ